ncbi:zinc knuckle CX2CX4HX4C containing protein [Tanacetum coccineum]
MAKDDDTGARMRKSARLARKDLNDPQQVRSLSEAVHGNKTGVERQLTRHEARFDTASHTNSVNKGFDQNLGSIFVDSTKGTGNVVESTIVTNNVMFGTEVTGMSISTAIGSNIIPESIIGAMNQVERLFFTSSSYDRSNNSGSYVVDNTVNVDGSKLPNKNNIAAIFGKAAMDAIETVWKKLLADVTGNMAKGTSSIDDTVPCMDSPIVQYVFIQSKPNSYAGAAGSSASEPWKVVETISTRFENTQYGYFIGKRVAFLVVEYYARLEDVLESVSWVICNIPIILKKWNMNSSLLKEELTRISVWVKINDVPLQVFLEDGISLIASQIGKPIILDSYTSAMCIDSWGWSSFARCLIKVKADDVLKESLTMGVPLIDDLGFSEKTVRIEYEWEQPCCDTCKIFGHVHDQCPKNITVTPTPIVDKYNDGFQMVANKRKNSKAGSNNGVKFGGQSVKSNVKYVPKASSGIPKTITSKKNQPSKASELPSSSSGSQNGKNGGTYAKEKATSLFDSFNTPVSNSYACLDEESEEEVENVFDESVNLISSAKQGASSLPRAGEAA